MKKIERIIPILDVVRKKSLFLLGPRQTGKSSLIRSQFSQSPQINLLLNDDFLRYQKDPDLLIREFINKKKTELIIIDVVQRLPELLNAVHYLIEECGHRFLLTGSSARKLN